MSDVFISYSRSDREFVRKLFDALESKDYDAWIDWEDIEYAEDWWQKIQAGIEAADSFVFVITPESIRSKVCFNEIEHAVQNNKRIVPVLHQEITDKADHERMHPVISKHNWLPFTKQDIVEETLSDLLETIHRDPPHVKTHTRLLVRAHEWTRASRERSLLLRGEDLQQAEEWLTASINKEPVPTDLHAEYIAASRVSARNFQRKLFSGVTVALVVAIGLSILAFYLFQEANTERDRADQNAATSESNAQAAIMAQATSDRRANEAQSLLWTNAAQQAMNAGDQQLALPLVLGAARIENPSPLTQHTLANIAYATGGTRSLSGDMPTIYSLSLNADEGTALLGLDDGSIVLWDIAQEQPSLVMQEHTSAVIDLAASPDGQFAITSSYDSTMILWDLENEEVLHRFETNDKVVNAVAISPDGESALSGSKDIGLILWDLNTFEIIHLLEGHTGNIRSVAFSPDGQTALSGGIPGELFEWDLATGQMIRAFEGYEGSATSLAISSDGSTAVSGSNDGTVVIWDIEAGTAKHILQGHSYFVGDVAFSPDGQTILSGACAEQGVGESRGFSGSVCNQSELILWDANGGQQLDTLRGDTQYITGIEFGSDGNTAITASGGLFLTPNRGELTLWHLRPVQPMRTLYGHQNWVLSVAVSPDGQTALSGSMQGELIQWDLATGQISETFEGHQGNIFSVAISPDGQTALSGSDDNKMILWDLNTTEPIYVLEGHDGAVRSVAYSPDGTKAISGADDRSLIYWDLNTGSLLKRFDGQSMRVTSAAISPDGKTAISGSCASLGATPGTCGEGEIIVWDLETGQQIRAITGHSDAVNAVDFNATGDLFISGSGDTTLILWELATGQPMRTFVGHTDPVLSAAFSSDDQYIVSGDGDLLGEADLGGSNGTVIVWDVATGQPLRTFSEHDGAVWSVVLDSSGNFAISGSSDKSLMLWRIESLDSLLQWTEENYFIRELTCSERTIYAFEPGCDEQGAFPTRTPYPGRELTATH